MTSSQTFDFSPYTTFRNFGREKSREEKGREKGIGGGGRWEMTEPLRRGMEGKEKERNLYMYIHNQIVDASNEISCNSDATK